MKRDMDLIRELLLRLEALPMQPGDALVVSEELEELAVPSYDAGQVAYHLSLIYEAGFINDGGESPVYEGRFFRGLTWTGHDFLDSVRDPEIWAATKKGADGAKGFTFELLRDLAKGLLKKQIEEYTGVQL